MRPIFLAATIVLAMFSGCFGEEVESIQPSELTVVAPESVLRGQYFTIEVASDLEWTMNRSPGFYFMDEYGVLRDDVEMTFAPIDFANSRAFPKLRVGAIPKEIGVNFLVSTFLEIFFSSGWMLYILANS